jgi:hypothetical protein
MAFATLEEAWGVRAFTAENDRQTSPAATMPLSKQPPVTAPQRPAVQIVPRRPAPSQPVPVARPINQAAHQAVRDALDVVLRSQGRNGVARVLGDDLMRRICGPMGGPITFETVVTLLIAAFAIFVILDSLF